MKKRVLTAQVEVLDVTVLFIMNSIDHPKLSEYNTGDTRVSKPTVELIRDIWETGSQYPASDRQILGNVWSDMSRGCVEEWKFTKIS